MGLWGGEESTKDGELSDGGGGKRSGKGLNIHESVCMAGKDPAGSPHRPLPSPFLEKSSPLQISDNFTCVMQRRRAKMRERPVDADGIFIPSFCTIKILPFSSVKLYRGEN